jgi:hypothetical protein
MSTVTLPAEDNITEADLNRDDVMTSAELAECTCPEWCERDHDRD